jgi:pimeloyl-ACP methyl ester carboxylesterase
MHPLTLSPGAKSWQQGGSLVEIAGRRIFVRQVPGTGPPLVFLHGYPTSSHDWARVLGHLPGRRVVCFDFLGYGLSDKPRDHTYSLHAQADLAEAIAHRYVDAPAILIAHDMGTSVATELLARSLEGRLGMQLAAVLLLNGSMVIERSSPTLGQRILRSRFGPLLARWSNESLFRRQLSGVFSRAHPLRREDAEDAWSLVVQQNGHRLLDKLVLYMSERTLYAKRWHGALRDWPGRLELAWAMRDPVATKPVLDAILELRPRTLVTRLEALGHYPQIEDPQTISALVARLADSVARPTSPRT